MPNGSTSWVCQTVVDACEITLPPIEGLPTPLSIADLLALPLFGPNGKLALRVLCVMNGEVADLPAEDLPSPQDWDALRWAPGARAYGGDFPNEERKKLVKIPPSHTVTGKGGVIGVIGKLRGA